MKKMRIVSLVLTVCLITSQTVLASTRLFEQYELAEAYQTYLRAYTATELPPTGSYCSQPDQRLRSLLENAIEITTETLQTATAIPKRPAAFATETSVLAESIRDRYPARLRSLQELLANQPTTAVCIWQPTATDLSI